MRLGFKPSRGRQPLPGRFDSCCLPPPARPVRGVEPARIHPAPDDAVPRRRLRLQDRPRRARGAAARHRRRGAVRGAARRARDGRRRGRVPAQRRAGGGRDHGLLHADRRRDSVVGAGCALEGDAEITGTGLGLAEGEIGHAQQEENSGQEGSGHGCLYHGSSDRSGRKRPRQYKTSKREGWVRILLAGVPGRFAI